MIRPPPKSPLFPYTTLFRSVSAERGAQLVGLPQCDPRAAEALLLKARRLGSALHKVFAAMLRKQRIAGEWLEPVKDRKSTRLNSSHGYISYAVFCLEKKHTC